MLRLRRSRAFALSVCLIAVACSNGSRKKKPIGNDASTYEGGADGNGAGGSDAGVDAPMEAAPEAAPEAQADAPVDSPSEPEAGLTCSAGTIKDYAQQACLMCPSDAGLEGGADAGATDGGADAASDGGGMDATSDAAADPYAQVLDCNGVIGNTSGSYDPTAGVLDFQIAYPLDISTVSISGSMLSGQQPMGGFSIPNIPVSGNHVTLTIGTPPNGVDQIVIDTFDMTDACGRSTSYDPGVTCINLAAVPDDGGTGWTVSCVPYPC